MEELIKHLKKHGLIKRIQLTNKKTGEVESKELILYDGLRHIAKSQGLMAVETELIQAPSAENRWTAIVRAKASMKSGCFTGIGDANPQNVTSRVKPHFIRLAETRAKARAFRDAVDLQGLICFDELEDDSLPKGQDTDKELMPVNNSRPSKNSQRDETLNFRPMTAKQRRFLLKLLAGQGLEESEALTKLKASFDVDDLDLVTIQQANKLISHHTSHPQRNGNGNYPLRR